MRNAGIIALDDRYESGLPMKILAFLVLSLTFFLVVSGCTQSTTPSSGPGASVNDNTLTTGNRVATDLSSHGKIIAAYWFLNPNPSDDTYDLVISAPDRIPWKKINRIYIGFATVDNGVLTDLPVGDSENDLTLKTEMQQRIRNVVSMYRQNNPEGQVFITSNFGEDLDPQYLLAAQDPQKFADSVLAYLKENDLDGYDMDWESSRIDDYSPQLDALLSACHTTFSSAGENPRGQTYLLTHTVWPGVESAQTVAGLKDIVDQLNLMTYGTGEKYDLATYADSYAQEGFPYDKMLAGVESEAGYSDNVGPDTEQSVASKCMYARDHNLAGIFEWRLDNDMRPDNSPPTYQVTEWMSSCFSG